MFDRKLWLCFVLLFVVDFAFLARLGDAAAGKEACLFPVGCGGQGENIVFVGHAPPGLMSLCGPDQKGKACNWCDDNTNTRFCSPSAACRTCVLSNPQGSCGNPMQGTCTADKLGNFNYFYCKDNKGGAGKAGACNFTNQCDKDQ